MDLDLSGAPPAQATGRALASGDDETASLDLDVFGPPPAQATDRACWCVSVMRAGLAPLIVLDIWEHLTPEDREYFRTTREKRFGRLLAEVQAGRESKLEPGKSLDPIRLVVRERSFLGGDGPFYADYVAFAPLQWAHDQPVQAARRA